MTENDQRFEMARKEFYRLWYYSHKASEHARGYMRKGDHENAAAASAAFRRFAELAKEAYVIMDSMRPPRPAIIDTDVAIEEDLHLAAPGLFLEDENLK